MGKKKKRSPAGPTAAGRGKSGGRAAPTTATKEREKQTTSGEAATAPVSSALANSAMVLRGFNPQLSASSLSILEEKRRGNMAFQCGEYLAATLHYSRAIGILMSGGGRLIFSPTHRPCVNPKPLLIPLLANRATAFLRMGAALAAQRDVQTAFAFDPKDPAVFLKIYVLAAFVHLQLQRPAVALAILRTLLASAGGQSAALKRLVDDVEPLARRDEGDDSQQDDYGLLDLDASHLGSSLLADDPSMLWEEQQPGRCSASRCAPCRCTTSSSCADCPLCSRLYACSAAGLHALSTWRREALIGGERARDPRRDNSDSGGDELPRLIPVGEPLTLFHLHANHCQPIPEFGISRASLVEKALNEKEAGNEAFAKGQKYYLVALAHYTRAIQLHPEDAVFFSNRALVYLKLGRYLECVSDCTASIQRREGIKAYHRRAAAWAALGDYERACCDYRRALHFDNNLNCLLELERCLSCLADVRQARLGQLTAPPKKKKKKGSAQEPPCVVDELRALYEESLRDLALIRSRIQKHPSYVRQPAAD